MKTTRRDLFKFAAGGGAGLMLTPAPWRMVTDTALWSENWPGVPRPLRGEFGTRFTHCALCPAGCAVKARCVGNQPISLVGLPGKPLCAFGLMGHQLPYHANRITKAETDKVREIVSKRITTGSIAVLDLRPGRTASWTYRRAMAALPHGIYLAPQSALPAVNLDAVKTILSLSVPVLDGWGTPANVLAARKHFRLIQVEPSESRTAMLADEWLRILPGSEQSLVETLCNTGDLVAGAQSTGLSKARILSLAEELAEGDAVVLSTVETPAVLALNRKLGALGRAIASRREAPTPNTWSQASAITAIDTVPDRSLGVLLIDETAADAYYPWTVLESKLAPDSVVVTFASTRAGYGRHAHFTLPTPVYPEMLDDIPPAIDSLAATFRLTSPLADAPRGVAEPSQFIAALAGIDASEALRERANAIRAECRGTLHVYAEARSLKIRDVTRDDFWKSLNQGGCWMDDTVRSGPPPDPRPSAPAVVAMTWEGRAARGPMPPLVSKLYQESNLRARI